MVSHQVVKSRRVLKTLEADESGKLLTDL